MPRSLNGTLQQMASDIRQLKRWRRNMEAVTLGEWTIHENDAGDLVATHDNGTTRTIAGRG